MGSNNSEDINNNTNNLENNENSNKLQFKNDPKLKTEKVSVKEFIIDFIMGYVNNDLSNLACQVSFRFLLGIFPFILFILTFLATINLDMSYLAQHVDVLPDFTVQLLTAFAQDISSSTTPVGLISSTFIISIYSSSKAFKTVIEAVNRIYFGEIKLSLIKRYILSIIFVFLFLFLIILPLIYYVFADAIWLVITMLFNVTVTPLSTTSSILLFICMVVYLTILVMLIYGMSLGKDVKLRSTMPGAIVCVFSWWVSSYGFNFYVTNISNYSKVYGSIGTVILFFLWINIITLVLLVGSLVNKIFYTYTQEHRRLIYLPKHKK